MLVAVGVDLLSLRFGLGLINSSQNLRLDDPSRNGIQTQHKGA